MGTFSSSIKNTLLMPINYLGRKLYKKRPASDPLALVEPLLGVYNEKLDGRRHRVEWNHKQACQEGFESSTWVYACITTWMSQVASVPWIVREKSGQDGEWMPAKDTDLEMFLCRPNPFMSWGDMAERLTADLLIGGNHIWKKNYVRGKLREVWPLDPDRIKPTPDRVNFIANYSITEDSVETEDIDPKLVVHFMLQNPRDIFWGMSPLKAVAKVLDCDLEALQWWVNAVYSGCRKDGVLSFKHDLTPDQYDMVIMKLREQLMSNISGRFPIVMGHEATYTPYDMSPAELDFTNSRKMTREEIAAAFKVPPPLIGILDHSTYNNLTTARRIFWVDAVLPFLERIKATLNRCILPDFYKGSDLFKYRIDFDISKVEALADDFSKKLEQAQILLGMGVPLNVIIRRLELDLPEIEGGDVGYILENYIPLDLVGAKYGATPDGSPEAPGASLPKVKDPKDPRGTKVPPKPKLDSLNKKEQERFDLLFEQTRAVLEEVLSATP